MRNWVSAATFDFQFRTPHSSFRTETHHLALKMAHSMNFEM